MGSPARLRLGDQLEVFWSEAQGWYQGSLETHEPSRHFPYKIAYTDGDVEWVRFGEAGGVLEALEDVEDDTPQAVFRERPYRILGRPATEATAPVPAVAAAAAAAAAGEPPPKRKRGRPPGSGKASKAKAAAAAAAAAAAQAPEQHRAVASGKKKQRTQQEAAQPAHQQGGQQQGAQQAAEGVLSGRRVEDSVPGGELPPGVHAALKLKLQSMVKGLPSSPPSSASITPRAAAAAAAAAAAGAEAGPANGGLQLGRMGREVGSAAPAAASLPAAAAAAAAAEPQRTPAAKPPAARDPRQRPAPDGTPSLSPTKRRRDSTAASQPPQQPTPSAEPAAGPPAAEQPQQSARPDPAPPSVSVIGFQFSAELATITAPPEEDGMQAADASADRSRGATPHGPRRSASHGGLQAASTPGASGAAGAAAGAAAAGDGAQQQDAAAANGEGPPSEEELEREVACRSFGRMLVGLARTKESIGRATGLALQAAKCNAGPKLVRMVLERMNSEDSNQQRVNLLYLVDSILQTSVRERDGRTDCGPQSPAGQAYPRVVGAALTRLVEAVARDVQATEKLEKVLLIWQRRAIISDTLLEPALLLARTRRAQHDAAWGDDGGLAAGAASPVAAAAASAPGSAGAQAAGRGGAAHGAGAKRAVPVSGPEFEAAYWRLWRRLPMNSVLLFKFIDQKTGAVVQMTQRSHANEWEDMDALRAEAEARGVQLDTPSAADLPVSGTSFSSPWESDSSLAGGSPPPDASPWHWASLREAKRSAAQQEQAWRAAADTATAAQVAQWAQLVASSKQQAQQTQQQGSAEPDEFEQEMLQQMAGGSSHPPQPALAPGQQDPWSQLSTMEAEAGEGLYGGAPWNLPGARVAAGAAAAASASALAGVGEEAPPPLPEGPPPLPPDDGDDEYGDGPPPLPAYSPPHDEYAPAEFGGQPPLPPAPPPDEGGEEEMGFLVGGSPDGPPPLPPGPPPPAPKSPYPSEPDATPLLPPGFSSHPQRQLPAGLPQPPLPAPAPAPSPAGHPASGPPRGPPPATVAAVRAALSGPVPGPRLALRTWTGFVSEVLPNGQGMVDAVSQDSGFFVGDAVQGTVLLQVGDRVRCEAQEYPSGSHFRWRITSIRLDHGEEDDLLQEGEDGPAHGVGVPPDAALSHMPPGFGPRPPALALPPPPPQQQQQHHVPGQAQGVGQMGRAGSWHESGLLGDLPEGAMPMDVAPPGFVSPGVHPQGQPAWGPAAVAGSVGQYYPQHPVAAQQRPMMPHPMQPNPQLLLQHQQHQQQYAGAAASWHAQPQQQQPGAGYTAGWGSQH